MEKQTFYLILREHMVYCDQICLYAINLDQDKNKLLINDMNEIKSNVGHNVLVCSNNKILPVKEMQNSDLQNKVIFDDFATTDVQNQSNSIAAIFVLCDFPSTRKRNLIAQELGINKGKYIKSYKQTIPILFLCESMKKVKRNVYGNI